MEALTMHGGAKIRDTCEALKDVLDDFNIVFSEGGIHINSLDINNVALINATLWDHSFERYSCANMFVCRLNMAVLYKTFKPVNKATHLTLRIDEQNPKALAVCMENAVTGFRFDVRLKIWSSDKKILHIDNSIFNRYVTLPSPDFQSLIAYISNFQNSGDDDNKIVDIELSDNELVLSSRGPFGVVRAAVRERNTGMNVSKTEMDPLDDKLVKKEVEAEEAAIAAEKASHAAASQHQHSQQHQQRKKQKKSKSLHVHYDGDGDETRDEDYEDKNKDDNDDDGGDDNEEDDEEQQVSKKRPRTDAPTPVAQKSLPTAGSVSALAANVSTTTLVNESATSGGGEVVKNSYNLKYMRFFTKATMLSTSVRIFIRRNYPIIIMYNIGTMGVLRYCLGPASAEDAEIEMDDDDDNVEVDEKPSVEKDME